jgi:hypothetical protein
LPNTAVFVIVDIIPKLDAGERGQLATRRFHLDLFGLHARPLSERAKPAPEAGE